LGFNPKAEGGKMYETEWFSKGSVITAENMLYCYDERRGNVALVENNPREFKVVSSFRITEGSGAYWAHPTIYNKKLLVRHGDVLMVYDIEDKSLNQVKQ
jgi:hypothetical protein